MFKKVLSFVQKHKTLKKVVAVGCALCVMAISCVTAFATDGTTVNADTVDSIKQGVTGIFTDLNGVFNFGNLIQFVGIGIVACATIVLGYIGVRKLVSMIKAAIKGKLRSL